MRGDTETVAFRTTPGLGGTGSSNDGSGVVTGSPTTGTSGMRGDRLHYPSHTITKVFKSSFLGFFFYLVMESIVTCS